MLTKAQIKRRLKRVLANFYRISLKNQTFTILSNNCFGGVIYDKFALSYLTPTIGCWIPPTDYIRFLGNLPHYLAQDVVQISWQESHVADILRQRKESGRYNFALEDMIIGRIDDVDIIFIHYTNFADAKEKWNRRKLRINMDNLVVKCNDQNGCTYEDFQAFCNLPFRNKLFITANPEWHSTHTDVRVVFVKKYEKDGYVVNDTTHGDVPINMTRYLNQIQKSE